MWQIILAGGILGVISSLHCIGMCGPLALALPVFHLNKPQRSLAIMFYNAGRILTYSFLGLLLGLAGRSVYIAGFQQEFSIVMGVSIVVITVYYFVFKRRLQTKWMAGFHSQLQQVLGKFLKPNRIVGFVIPGMLNGLLPCGMVYLAIAGAAGSGDVGKGTLFMFAFGLGTAPAMLALGLFGLKINLSIRQQAKKALPYVISAMGLLLILRGMNLGIPFISPVLPGSLQPVISCH